MPLTRRDFVRDLSGAAVGGPLLARADAQVTPDLVELRPEVESLVALIEKTPREKCAVMLAGLLGRGVSYRQMLAALFLAAVRNVNPRPPGFALHSVFVIHSAHLLSLEAPADARLLPLFFALDNFKGSQERDASAAAGDFTMRPFRGRLPAPERAGAELVAAMEAWDVERAERAVISMARQDNASGVFETLWSYGARDYRNIGHKAIYVANAFRTLHAIGWQHAEPVVRSLVLSLLDFGREERVNGYAFEDQCYLSNVKRSHERLPGDWNAAGADETATRAVLDLIRKEKPDPACGAVAQQMASGQLRAAAVWDAVHLAAAELRMRARKAAGLVALHAVTSANALRQAWLSTASPPTRFLILLQAVGWMGQFTHWSATRETDMRDLDITRIEPEPVSEKLDEVLADTFQAIPADLDKAAANVFAIAGKLPAREAFAAAARRLVLTRADEVHHYKYSAALTEDVALVSPRWQPHLTAAAVFYMKGSQAPETAVVKRAREALRTLPA